MPALAQIWRHPVKGVGAEELGQVALEQDRPLPLDRAWAILTGKAADTGEWQSCRFFARGCYGPALMAVTAETDGPEITFSHPDLPDLRIDPELDGARLVSWITQIYPEDRPAPHTLIRAPKETGMSDAPYGSVSVLNLSSLRALSQRAGRALDPRRFRGNLWIDGFAPMEELGWEGRSLRIGDCELRVEEPIGRCRATHADPSTGRRDTDVMGLLKEGWGHTDFGIKAVVTRAGTLKTGDPVEVI